MQPSAPTTQEQLYKLHEPLFAMIDALLVQPAASFGAGYHKLVSAIEQDFRQEEQWMESCQCPGAHQHREQHARMQAGLHHAAAALEQGDPAPARQAATALREWLPFHIATQDQPLLLALRQASFT
jgi:hemerythrin